MWTLKLQINLQKNETVLQVKTSEGRSTISRIQILRFLVEVFFLTFFFFWLFFFQYLYIYLFFLTFFFYYLFLFLNFVFFYLRFFIFFSYVSFYFLILFLEETIRVTRVTIGRVLNDFEFANLRWLIETDKYEIDELERHSETIKMSGIHLKKRWMNFCVKRTTYTFRLTHTSKIIRQWMREHVLQVCQMKKNPRS